MFIKITGVGCSTACASCGYKLVASGRHQRHEFSSNARYSYYLNNYKDISFTTYHLFITILLFSIEQLREVLRMGQWLAEPIGTQLSEQGATNTNTGGDRNSGSGIGNQQFIPLSSYHDRTVTMSINYLQ